MDPGVALALSLGQIGLTLDDFYRLSPAEFAATADKWREQRELDQQISWEQTREICYYSVAPHCKNRLSKKTFMRFPWEAQKNKKRAGAREPGRQEELKRKYGGTI